MKTELNLTKNMSVYTSDDKKVGDVKHVVVEPATSKITHLVVEQGFILTEDKVLPIKYIDRQEDGVLYLDRPWDALDLLDYEETYFVNQEDGQVTDDFADVQASDAYVPQPVYYYPPTPLIGPGAYYWGLPGYDDIDPWQQVVRRNVPKGSLVIEEGANVYSSDGDHVGDVYSVHVDSETNRITHFIISQGLIFHDYKLIPVFWVNGATSEGITVAVNTEQMKKLPSYEPEKA